MGAAYLFHDLYGYIMEMSADIALMIESFDDGVDTEETIDFYRDKLGDADPRQFVEILVGHAVLVDPEEDELEAIWSFVPIKGKWNVWQRRSTPGRLTLWTAWGDRPIQQVFLDEDETKMWDAFDGTKRLIELRHLHDSVKLQALVRKLVHHDVQALKLSVMPWSVYAKRPQMAPAYLGSTMPYPKWRPGDAIPGAPALDEYHKESVVEADAQFDHRETTLSHLLRVPHPALGGRTYGQTLIDTLLARGAIPDGRVRVLEIGAGLGYVARDALARLRATGREVDYTIIELSPVLETAQRKVVTGATWLSGNALELEPSGVFDLILANEMAGDLPARHLARADVGLAEEGSTVDRDKLRALGGGAALAADLKIPLDDAPDPFFLQTGAFELIARIARWLAPGGTTIVSEFGEIGMWPRLSTHLDHPELSTHFGQLEHAARASGLDAKIEFVIDLLDLDRTQQGLATTRSHFRALRALAADAGIDLAKIGYTPALFADAVGGKLDVETIGDLRWDKIEDRLMGLVPHEFKAIVARRKP